MLLVLCSLSKRTFPSFERPARTVPTIVLYLYMYGVIGVGKLDDEGSYRL